MDSVKTPDAEYAEFVIAISSINSSQNNDTLTRVLTKLSSLNQEQLDEVICLLKEQYQGFVPPESN